MIDVERLRRVFEAEFGRPPRIYRAPGRVNLIGEHTDYNDGFAMPIALDRAAWVAAAPRGDRTIVARSDAFGERVSINLDGSIPPRTGHWSDYVRGVAATLDRDVPLRGADLLIESDVPVGAGLSSSAALEVGCGFALLDLSGVGRVLSDPAALTALARACQQAEHDVVGTRCGLMDQFIACHGRPGQAAMLDTRSLACRWLPLPSHVRVMVCNTMVKHQLASAEYNARRADCEAGVRVLARRFPHVLALRDVTHDELDAAAADMPERIYRRCRHVVTENARVVDAACALHLADLEQLGRLMRESHRSLRDDYEVSCAELDAMVRAAADLEGVYGARMTGGGFGGCAVVLVEEHAAEDVGRQIREKYEAATGRRPDVWQCATGAGVGVWGAGDGFPLAPSTEPRPPTTA